MVFCVEEAYRNVVVMQGHQCFYGWNLKEGLINVREEWLVANIFFSASPFLKVIPEILGAVVLVIV